ncbi:MAG: response regulator [Vulcanimicrobiota bacterium]
MARDLTVYFLAEAREIVQNLSQDTLNFESRPTAELLSRMFRLAHTLKGAARVAKQPGVAQSIHQFEEILGAHRDAPESLPAKGVEELFRLLDEITAELAKLEPAAQPSSPREKTEAPPGGTQAVGVAGLPGHHGVDVDRLLEDLRAATGQLEGLRSNLLNIERGKTLGELLLAQLTAEGVPKSVRFVAEELQAELRGLERNLAFGVDQMGRELREAQESTEKLRLVRADALFPLLRRALRDAATEQGCEVELLALGGEVRLEATVLSAVQNALIQALRNSVAHGIESPPERQRAGKPTRATVRLEIARRGRRVVFRCRDDGRGIDLAAAEHQLRAKGVPVAGLDREGLLLALMQGGVSTAGQVTQAAGRGIGLDVIRQTAAEFGGEAHLQTEAGKFTEVIISLPWAAAGMDFLELCAQADHQEVQTTLLLPLDCVRAVLGLKPEDILRQADGETIVYEGQAVRMLSLNVILGISEAVGRAVAVLEASQGLVALSVSSFQGVSVARLLPLPFLTEAASFIAGATLDAHGDARLVLDPDGLFEEARQTRSTVAETMIRDTASLLVIDDSLTTRMLQQSILESAGYKVDLANSAEQGLEKLQERPYDLILVDVEMPGIDGFTFVERIRADPALQAIPAILVTSRDAPEDKLRGRNVGAQGYMVKSEFDQKQMLQQIRKLLR